MDNDVVVIGAGPAGLASGSVMHSRAYRNAAPFSGQRVLVGGFGNTGAEIALDMALAGVGVTLSHAQARGSAHLAAGALP